jgi:hypothetical protein
VKNGRMKVLSVAVVSTIAIGVIGFTAGCETQEILKNRPCVPPPSNQEPSSPVLAVPSVAAPIVAQPAPAVATPAPAPVETVPK